MKVKHKHSPGLGRLLLCEFHQGSYYSGDAYWDIRFETPPRELNGEIYSEYSQNISYGNKNTHIVEDVDVEVDVDVDVE